MTASLQDFPRYSGRCCCLDVSTCPLISKSSLGISLSAPITTGFFSSLSRSKYFFFSIRFL